MTETPFRPREKLFEKQKYFQSTHRYTHLKGPMDKITSVAIPLALAGSSLFLIVSSFQYLLFQRVFLLLVSKFFCHCYCECCPGPRNLQHESWERKERMSLLLPTFQVGGIEIGCFVRLSFLQFFIANNF